MNDLKLFISKECFLTLKILATRSYPSKMISDSLSTITEMMSEYPDSFADLNDVATTIREYKTIVDGVSSDPEDHPHTMTITPGITQGVRFPITIEGWLDDNCAAPSDYQFDIRQAMHALMMDDGVSAETRKKVAKAFERISFLLDGIESILINNGK